LIGPGDVDIGSDTVGHAAGMGRRLRAVAARMTNLFLSAKGEADRECPFPPSPFENHPYLLSHISKTV
jgi:hypothetical protein